ncbi:MAG: Rieske (2Fe-2S) protein [archaeon]|nr:Rieske (2Fe-2S) protein [archaeon]
MTKTFKVARLQDIPPGSMKAIMILNHDILIINLDGILYGVEARCPHKSYPLKLGSLKKRALRCGFRHVEFDIKDGKVLFQPIDARRPARNLKRCG